MTFAEFKLSVRDRLPLDAKREGAQVFIDKEILAAVSEIQRLCPGLRDGFESIYQPENCDVESHASKAAMPSVTATISQVSIVKMLDGVETERAPLRDKVPWDYRQNMVYGLRAGYSVSPGRTVFYFSPVLKEDQILSVVWSGRPDSFSDTDSSVLLFSERVAAAVADYVSAELARKSDNDLQLATSYTQSWGQALQALYLDFK